MSQENVEIVRRYFAAYDSGALDAIAEFWHPDIEWRAVEGYIDDVGVIRGPDGMRQYYGQWEETFDAIRPEIEELIEAGDQVVAVLRGGANKDSDAEIDIRYAVVISVREGKIAGGREHATGSRPSKPPGCGSSRSGRIFAFFAASHSGGLHGAWIAVTTLPTDPPCADTAWRCRAGPAGSKRVDDESTLVLQATPRGL